MRKFLCLISFVAILLTGCSANNEEAFSETTSNPETITVTEAPVSETSAVTETTTVTEITDVPETTVSIQITTTETETTTVSESILKNTDSIIFNSYNENDVDGIYVAGSKASLNFYTYLLGNDILSEWGKDIDFEQDAVVMNVIKDRSSSYEFTLYSVYVMHEQIIFDYKSYCPETYNEDLVSYVMAAVIPKEKLSYLENDDEWGIELDASYNPNEHCVNLNFLQWGEKNTRELLSGSWYELERYDEEKGWCKVEYSKKFDNAEIAWTDEGWIIADYGHSVFTQNLALYDELQTGKYRISKSVINLRRAGVYDEKIYYAEFEHSVNPAC